MIICFYCQIDPECSWFIKNFVTGLEVWAPLLPHLRGQHSDDLQTALEKALSDLPLGASCGKSMKQSLVSLSNDMAERPYNLL